MAGRGKGFFLGAFIGTLVGGITALLFAPKSGDKLRKDLARTYDDLSTKTEDLIENATDQMQDLVEKTKAFAGEAKEKAEDILRELKK